MDEDRDRDPHQSNGLSCLGPIEGQKEEEDEQGSQDCKGLVHLMRQSACPNGSPPNLAGLGLNDHVIKPDSLNGED